MAGDIEAFLRMAAERRRQAEAGQVAQAGGPARQQPPPPAARPARPEPAPPPAPRQRPRHAHQESHSPGQPASIGEIPMDPYLQKELDRDSQQRQDDRTNRRQQDDRPHVRLGSLTKYDDRSSAAFAAGAQRERDQADKNASGAAMNQVLRMLTDPSSLAAAIMVNEILRRPNFDDVD